MIGVAGGVAGDKARVEGLLFMDHREIGGDRVLRAIRILIGRVESNVVEPIGLRYGRVGLKTGVETKGSEREIIGAKIHLPGGSPVRRQLLRMQIVTRVEAQGAEPAVAESAVGAG